MANGTLRTEIIEERTMYDKKFYLGGQKYEMVCYSYPVHYLSDNKEWLEIDNSIKSLNQWEFTNGVTSNIFKAYFEDKTNNENNHLFGIEYDINHKSKWVNFKLVNGKYSDVKIYGENNNKVKFVDCLNNIDIEYVVLPDSLKENIILKNKVEEKTFDFSIKSDGVSIVKEENEYKIVDTETGLVIWNIDKPYMIDDEGKIDYGVKYDLIEETNNEHLIFRVTVENEKFLNEAKYPITIDPSVIIDPNDTSGVISAYYNGTSWNYTPTDIGGKHTDKTGAIYFTGIDSFKKELLEKGSNTVKLLSANLNLYIVQAIASSAYNLSSQYFSKVTAPFGNNTPPNGVRASNTIAYQSVARNYSGNISIDFKNYVDKDFYGIQLFYGRGDSADQWTVASPYYSDVTKRPTLTFQWTYRPSFMFHDGNPDVNGYFSDGNGNVFRYLDFGTIIAGTTSTPKDVYVRNYSDFTVNNVSVKVQNSQIADGVFLEISASRNPFDAQTSLIFNGSLESDKDIPFYARIRTKDTAIAGSIGNILANGTAST